MQGWDSGPGRQYGATGIARIGALLAPSCSVEILMKASLLLMAVLVLTVCHLAATAEEDAKFKITTKKTDDSVTIQTEKEKTIFVVKSPSGISQATIERTEEKWPEVIVLRLHLKGLENFKVSNGKVTLHAAVSMGKVRQWKDGKEKEPLQGEDPFWMPFRAPEGQFELLLPKAFLADNPKSITINWIDFYRG
jgi:hypothetical protein